MDQSSRAYRASQMMQQTLAPGFGVVQPCQQGNRFWLENLSEHDVSVAFSVNNKASPIVPPGRDEATLLLNTVEETRGVLEMSVNGEAATLLGNIDNALIEKPEDLICGLVVGPRAERRPAPPATAEMRIPFLPGESNDAELSRFLPEGIDRNSTEIDMVMVWLAPQGRPPLRQGYHQVDNLSDYQLDWLWECLHLNTTSSSEDDMALGQSFSLRDSLYGNTTSTTGGEVAAAGRYLTEMGRQHNRGMIVQALRELIAGGRFYVRQIPSWGGRYAVIFRGSTGSRSFLTAAMYGIDNARMTYISSYAQVASDVLDGRPGGAASSALRGSAPALTRAAPFVSGNFIGFVISAAFDVNEFVRSENPEENWGELLGALGVSFVKVWAAGFVGVLAAGILAATVLAGAPVYVIVGVGALVAIGVGIGLDYLDNEIGAKDWVKEKVRKIGNEMSSMVGAAFAASVEFLDAVQSSVRQSVAGWIDDARFRLRQAGDAVWGLIFCSSDPDGINDDYEWCLIGR
ncbi:hypothetical protein [Billgrantia aerodenitrificans]|uniref:Uncharacterized protein n=1 Tax=Billgrantia aerodenitrificans TaxID=2733483 RepID=A0ABS9AU95_9GAMM|nr:hypothetical protein [Halomonas aerodenitrificans]MCE8025319.1 hypothetical protein [Halomonas aerodenitrificans]